MQQQVEEKVEEVEAMPSTASSQPLSNIPETLRTRLRTQIEFYFSPQNLARDTYLRNMLATYGGAAVPLAAIANFPKVRNLCASELGIVNSNAPADPHLLMNVLGGSNIVSVTPDATWISPLLPIPPLDPSVKVRPISTAASPYVPDMRPPQQPSPNLAGIYGRDSPIVNTLVVRDMPIDVKPDKVIEIFSHQEIVPKTAKVEAGNVWFVSFSTEDDAKKILALKQELNIEGHNIYVNLAPVSHQQHMIPNYYAANSMPQIVTMPQQGINPGYIYSYPYRPMPSNGPPGYYMYPNLGHGHPMQYQQMYHGGIPPYRANAGQQKYFQTEMGRPFHNDKNKMRPLDNNGKVPPEGSNQHRNNKYDKKTSSSNGTESGFSGHQGGSFKANSKDANASKGMNRTKSQNEMSDSSSGEKKKNRRKNNSRKRDHDRRKDEVKLNVNDFPALSSGMDALEKQSPTTTGFSGYASALLRKADEKIISKEEEHVADSMQKLNITNGDIGQSSNSLTSSSSPNLLVTSPSKKETVVEGNGHKEKYIDTQNANHRSPASTNVDDTVNQNKQPIVSEEMQTSINSSSSPWGGKRSFIDVVKKS